MAQDTVHVFVFNTLSDWELAYAAVGINNPLFQQQPGRYALRTVGPSTELVRSMGGITILPDMSLDALEPRDSAMLILPGGEAWEQDKHPEAVTMASRFLEAGVPVAAICGATTALARGGLLDARRHTSNTRDCLLGTGYGGATLYQDEPAVTDGLLITASGLAPLDFAYHIFRRLGIFNARTLEAWRHLFKTGDPAYYRVLMESAQAR
jgi:putative intracellular protease/amidase